MKSETITFFAYDTVCVVSATADEACPLPRCLEAIRERAKAIHARLSMFEEDSELSRLNREYRPGLPWPVSGELFFLLEHALLVARETEGAFDPTIGPLVRLWNVVSENPAVPDQRQISATMERVGYTKVELDTLAKTVTLHGEGMVLDPGASGKGYAVEAAAKILREYGVISGFINFGGNIYVLGDRVDGQNTRPWRVAIQAPGADRGQAVAILELRDQGISTSSWYERYFELNGRRYHHILDPHTGWPAATDLQSVSIVSPSAFFTDLGSTGFFVQGEESGTVSLRRISETTGVPLDYALIRADGTLAVSKGIRLAEAL